MIDLLVSVVFGLWGTAVVVALLTDRDYGQSACLERDVHETAVTITLLPLGIVFLVAAALCYLVWLATVGLCRRVP